MSFPVTRFAPNHLREIQEGSHICIIPQRPNDEIRRVGGGNYGGRRVQNKFHCTVDPRNEIKPVCRYAGYAINEYTNRPSWMIKPCPWCNTSFGRQCEGQVVSGNADFGIDEIGSG